MGKQARRGRDSLSPGSRQPILLPQCIADLQYWVDTDPRIASRLLRLITDVLRDPFSGIGKPELLVGEAGVWSRRITDEHRLTYRVVDTHIHFLQARFHYAK